MYMLYILIAVLTFFQKKVWKASILTNEFFCDRIKTKMPSGKKNVEGKGRKNGKKKNVIN